MSICRGRGPVAVLAVGLGFASAAAPGEAPPGGERAAADILAPASAWLALLPEGETKRRFLLDCTGCHALDERTALDGGVRRTRASWEASTRKMLSFAGASSTFPIMSPDRDPAGTAEWLARHLADRAPGAGVEARASGSTASAAAAAGYGVTEYPLPQPDLPHDVAVAADGTIVVTGMLTGVLYTLDPATGEFAEKPVVGMRAADELGRGVSRGPDLSRHARPLPRRARRIATR